MSRRIAFFTDELTFWHHAGPHALILPAGGLDPLARMLLHSESFRAMTRMLREAAEALCGGRLLLVHEGGYSEAYVPFCGLAAIEELSGHRTEVADPLLDFLQLQQPQPATQAGQDAWVDALAALLA